jgi:hypothetical protein
MRPNKLYKDSFYQGTSFRQEIHKQLEALDIQMLRNFSNQELLIEIEAKKQVLRDATNQVDTMTTVEELKAASLPVLD